MSSIITRLSPSQTGLYAAKTALSFAEKSISLFCIKPVHDPVSSIEHKIALTLKRLFNIRCYTAVPIITKAEEYPESDRDVFDFQRGHCCVLHAPCLLAKNHIIELLKTPEELWEQKRHVTNIGRADCCRCKNERMHKRETVFRFSLIFLVSDLKPV